MSDVVLVLAVFCYFAVVFIIGPVVVVHFVSKVTHCVVIAVFLSSGRIILRLMSLLMIRINRYIVSPFLRKNPIKAKVLTPCSECV